jgi:hypothetical protein
MEPSQFFPDITPETLNRPDSILPALLKIRDQVVKADMAHRIACAALANPLQFEWSLQGFGMLRLHITPNLRLHIWDHRYAVPDVSMIHDHLQWGLESQVVAGQLTNHRYVEDLKAGDPYMYVTIKAGYNAFMKDEPYPTRLRKCDPEVYRPGESYSQEPSEIHYTEALPGTVTLMVKHPTEDADSARVFWLPFHKWVDAIPRKATAEEVLAFVETALRWPQFEAVRKEFEFNLGFLGACGDQVRKIEA